MGDRVAVGQRRGGTTFAELRRRAQVLGARVAGESVDALSFADANGVAVPVALFAAAWAGVPYAPVNYRLPEEQRERLIDRLGTTHHVGMGEGDGWVAGAGAGREQEAYPDEPTTPAVLLFTSGTTAEPKSAILEHDNLLAYALNTNALASADEDEAVLLAVPPFHIAGVAGVLSAVFSGRRIVPQARFSPEEWVDTAQREEVTHAFLVPTMLARIVGVLAERGGVELPTLRTLSYGGARMPVPVLERALALFPNAGFVNAYGLTETSATVTVLGPDEHREALASGDPAGWLVTGDLGRIDDQGFLFVHGRSDDVIIVGGENISPGEVEDCLLRHPAVTAAAVVGVPDEEWGEQVGAMVTTVGGIGPDELAAWVHDHLGGLKAPKIVTLAEELPMTPTGKVLRRVVRAELANSPA